MEKNKNQNEISDQEISKYKDPEGLSVDKMNFGLWLSENHKKILRLITAFLIAISVFFFLFSGYNYVRYFLNTNDTNLDAGAIVANRGRVTEDLIIGEVMVFPEAGKYDLSVELKNPNPKFFATFSYCFYRGADEAFCSDSFIMPSEDKRVLVLGRELPNTDDLRFDLRSVSWQRVDAHVIPDYAAYASERLNFTTSEPKFASYQESGLSERVGLNVLEFEVANRSSFGYYNVPLNIYLFKAGELVGVNRYIMINVRSGDSRQVKIVWPNDLPPVDRVEIVPEINILSESVYLKYGSPEAR